MGWREVSQSVGRALLDCLTWFGDGWMPQLLLGLGFAMGLTEAFPGLA